MFRGIKPSFLIAAISILSFHSAPGAVLVFTDFNFGGSAGIDFPQFQDGWGTGDATTVLAANAGPNGAGDYAAYLQMNGGVNHMHFMSGEIPIVHDGLPNWDSSAQSPYDGNYNALGVDSISFDFKHGGAGSDLTLRVHLWDADNNLKAVTSASVTVTASDTTWQTYTLSLKQSDLVVFGSSGNIDGILNNVTGISIRNTPVTTGGPGSSPDLDDATSFYIDNIKLSSVPEPSTCALFFGIASALTVCIRKKN